MNRCIAESAGVNLGYRICSFGCRSCIISDFARNDHIHIRQVHSAGKTFDGKRTGAVVFLHEELIRAEDGSVNRLQIIRQYANLYKIQLIGRGRIINLPDGDQVKFHGAAIVFARRDFRYVGIGGCCRVFIFPAHKSGPHHGRLKIRQFDIRSDHAIYFIYFISGIQQNPNIVCRNGTEIDVIPAGSGDLILLVYRNLPDGPSFFPGSFGPFQNGGTVIQLRRKVVQLLRLSQLKSSLIVQNHILIFLSKLIIILQLILFGQRFSVRLNEVNRMIRLTVGIQLQILRRIGPSDIVANPDRPGFYF